MPIWEVALSNNGSPVLAKGDQAASAPLFNTATPSAFFVFGFAKNERDNISEDDLKAFRRASQVALNLESEALRDLVEKGQLTEVKCDEEDLQE